MMKYLRLATIVLLQMVVVRVYAQFPANWYNLDPQKDSIFGVSTEKTYSELLQGKQAKTIIVAVIDGGTDVSHEDLQNVVWTNPNEIPGNGIDDDHNGYVDDIHGWDFIGGKTGDVKEDTYEMTRLYNKLNKKYASVDPKAVSKEDKAEYKLYQKVKADYEAKEKEMSTNYTNYSNLKTAIDKAIRNTGKDSVTLVDLQGARIDNRWDSIAVMTLRKYLSAGKDVSALEKALDGGLEYMGTAVKYNLNPNFDPRSIVGDNYNDVNEHYYGNNDVTGPNAEHGTHVAGIIAAERNNGIGINGIADHVQIMVIRVVPDGDERDKDVANAIRYAADNGASVVNMSFGKAYPSNKSVVDEAVKYAASKDVLLVHAAGNDSKNTDREGNYPTPVYENSKDRAPNWIEVGASTPYENAQLTASFSNYGKNMVDLFAPGYQINSTVPGSKYEANSGTSMASPVVAGVAALIRSYYPDLTAEQVKQVLVSSVVPVKYKVTIPGSKKTAKLSKLCESGGVVNAYKAAELASKTPGKKQPASAQR